MVVATKAKVDAVFKVGVGGRELKANEFIGAVEKTLSANVLTAINKLGVRLVN